MCVNGAFFHGTRVPVGAAGHSVKTDVFFIGCLEPLGSNRMVTLLCASSRLKADRCPQRLCLF